MFAIMMKLSVVLMFWILMIQNCNAQDVVRLLPIQFHQYMHAYSLNNPAYIGHNSDMEIIAGNQRQGGNWSSISTYYTIFNIALPFIAKETNDHSVFGVKIIGDNEGKYIGRNRFYLSYAWRSQIAQKLYFQTGLDAGFYNYVVKGTDLSGNASAFAPDGNFGARIYNADFHAGFAVNQIFNSKLQPFNEVTQLHTHYSFSGAYKLKASDAFRLIPSSYVRWGNKNDRLDIDLNLKSIIDQMVSAGIGYRINKGYMFFAGLEKIDIFNGDISFYFSYSAPLNNSKYININTYEINLNYMIDKKNNK